MRKVIFTKNVCNLKIDGLSDDTIVVVHEMYDKPNIDRRIIDWQKFKVAYSEYETSQYVIVGINRMITPQNRCDMVNDYLQTLTANIPKISVDTAPFVGEPWRVWFHYSVALSKWLGAYYSYPIEGEWQKWFYYEEKDCRLSGENLPLFIQNTESDLPKIVTAFEFYEPDNNALEFYDDVKRQVFEQFDTPKQIINNLLKRCNAHFCIDLDLDSYRGGGSIRVPNVGVYRYVVEENNRRMKIYNCFAKEGL